MGLNDTSSITSYSNVVYLEKPIELETKRYTELIEAECKLKTILRVAEKDKSQFGYSTETSKIIDAVLGIEREEK